MTAKKPNQAVPAAVQLYGLWYAAILPVKIMGHRSMDIQSDAMDMGPGLARSVCGMCAVRIDLDGIVGW